VCVAVCAQEVAHCFAVLELSHGYVFGRVRFAPPEPPAATDFRGKPKNFSAGLPVDLAGAAVMVGTGGRDEWRREEHAALAGISVLDPCCGRCARWLSTAEYRLRWHCLRCTVEVTKLRNCKRRATACDGSTVCLRRMQKALTYATPLRNCKQRSPTQQEEHAYPTQCRVR